MNKYDIAYWIVTAVGIIAALVMVTILTILVHRLVTITGHERVAIWLDGLMDDDAAYMEAEQERRTALFHGDDDASSLRRWYGTRYLIERALHRIVFACAWRLHAFQQDHLGLYTTITWPSGGQEDHNTYNR